MKFKNAHRCSKNRRVHGSAGMLYTVVISVKMPMGAVVVSVRNAHGCSDSACRSERNGIQCKSMHQCMGGGGDKP